MPEEKIIKLNLKNQLKSISKWRRRAALSRIIRKRLKNDKLKISQALNEKIWSTKGSKIRLKLVKDDKLVKAEPIE